MTMGSDGMQSTEFAPFTYNSGKGNKNRFPFSAQTIQTKSHVSLKSVCLLVSVHAFMKGLPSEYLIWQLNSTGEVGMSETGDHISTMPVLLWLNVVTGVCLPILLVVYIQLCS